ncbi:putative transposase (partial), partial [Erwinia amylovora ATCC 49946]
VRKRRKISQHKENWSMAYKLSQRAAGDFCEISDFRWREFGEAGQTADRMRRKLCLRRWPACQICPAVAGVEHSEFQRHTTLHRAPATFSLYGFCTKG